MNLRCNCPQCQPVGGDCPALSNWIKVSERKPEQLRDVLVAGSLQGQDIHIGYMRLGTWLTWRPQSGDGPNEINNVTHWQPMPEPPKEGV